MGYLSNRFTITSLTLIIRAGQKHCSNRRIFLQSFFDLPGSDLRVDTKNRIKEAEKNLERLPRHKKPEKMTPQDTQALNAAREALQAQTKDLVARWEATREL